MQRELLTADELNRACGDLDPGWDISPEALRRKVEFPSFLAAVGFIGELAPIAEGLDHHPDLRLSWRTVELDLSTHSAGGVSRFDVVLAAALDPLIARLSGRQATDAR
jgi:4a-hydroxytetrahydrobiopterin dehydratase